jgi:hypothetical protein
MRHARAAGVDASVGGIEEGAVREAVRRVRGRTGRAPRHREDPAEA